MGTGPQGLNTKIRLGHIRASPEKGGGENEKHLAAALGGGGGKRPFP